MNDCGGCQGNGAHKRWCEHAVGHSAAMYGRLSEEAEALGDRIGSNDPRSANLLYAASGRLRTIALTRKTEWQERNA